MKTNAMASNTVDISLLPAPTWNQETVLLKEFGMKYTTPSVAKIVKGQFMSIGAQKFSLGKSQNEVFVHSIKVGYKVLAHSVRRVAVESRRGYTRGVATLEQRLSIPLSYQGWFQLLSEDGKSPKHIESVRELAKHFPDRCLVRENVRAYTFNDEGKLSLDKSRVVMAGEQIRLVGSHSVALAQTEKTVKLLRCIDSNGDNIFFNFDQRSLFTPLAGPGDFTGILSIKDIVQRFRLPLTVQLVQGIRPNVDASRFTGLVRLNWVYSDESAFLCSLAKNSLRVLPVPTDVSIKLQAVENLEEYQSNETFRTIVAKTSKMVNNYNNTMHLIISVPDSAMKSKIVNTTVLSKTPEIPTRRSSSKEELLMQEVDQLYDYVKYGQQPPKGKFAYDSDEESYWEEPAYEPLDDFRARLAMIDKGEKVSYAEKYKPQKLEDIKPEKTEDRISGPTLEEIQRKLSAETERPTAPALPPRRYIRGDSVPVYEKKDDPKQRSKNRLSQVSVAKLVKARPKERPRSVDGRVVKSVDARQAKPMDHRPAKSVDTRPLMQKGARPPTPVEMMARKAGGVSPRGAVQIRSVKSSSTFLPDTGRSSSGGSSGKNRSDRMSGVSGTKKKLQTLYL